MIRFADDEFPNNVSGDSEGLRSLLVDGLHLTGEGYKIFLSQVLPLVGPNWSIEPPEAPSWIFPSVSPSYYLPYLSNITFVDTGPSPLVLTMREI